MQIHKSMPVIGRLFLVFAFLCAPVADHVHAIKMLGSGPADLPTIAIKTVEKMHVAEHAPCHEAMLASTEPSNSVKSEFSKQACCPYETCSSSNCQMHLAMNTMPAFELLPHIVISSRIISDPTLQLTSIPIAERLRPPIA